MKPFQVISMLKLDKILYFSVYDGYIIADENSLQGDLFNEI